MLESLNAAYSKNMAYQFTTSSGDTVSVNMGVEESASYAQNDRQATIEWMRSVKTELSIEGNGLSDADMEEIEEMMAKMQPTIDSFFTQEESPVAEAIRSIKEAIPPLLPEEKADTLASLLLDQGIAKLEDPSTEINKPLDDIRSFYEELIRKIRENAPLDLSV